MEKKYKIYCYTNIINNKKYIGQTARSLSERAGSKGQKYSREKLFYNAILKYGWENFSVQILKDNLTLEEANYWEEYYIQLYHTWIDDPLCCGYNLQKGGGNHQLSKEIREQISQTLKNKYNADMENGFKGKYHTQESKIKMSKGHFGEKNINAKKIKCIETGEIFSTITEAAQAKGLKSSAHIGQVARGKRKTSGGYHWEYVD